MSGYLSRVIDDQLDELFGVLPAISIDGAKGVGKTTTALRRAKTVFKVDDPDLAEILRADPERLRQAEPPVLVDEWQRFPTSWDVVRRAVDEDRQPGRFLLTGSVSPDTAPAHSGAGRIVPVRMRPLTLPERKIVSPTVSLRQLMSGEQPHITGTTTMGLEDYVDEILASGFPGIRDTPERARRELLDGYLNLIVERDFEAAGHNVRNPVALRRWMRAYAAATSTTASFEKIRDASTSGDGNKPAKSTAIPYRDTLERMWILDPLPGWLPTSNELKQLTQAPKHHLADPALAARLVGASKDRLLDGGGTTLAMPRNGTFLGALFESLVALSLRVFAPAASGTVSHLRTKGGRNEIDFIVERDDGGIVAIEVKLARTANDGDIRHLNWLRETTDCVVDRVVITTGTDAYRRQDGIAVVPLALLGP